MAQQALAFRLSGLRLLKALFAAKAAFRGDQGLRMLHWTPGAGVVTAVSCIHFG
jgi:hypothetical protein